MNYKLLWPPDFDEYAWEVELKGWCVADVEFRNSVIHFLFFDAVRLRQTIEDDLASQGVFLEAIDDNVVVVPLVTRDAIEKAVEFIYTSGRLDALVSHSSSHAVSPE